MEKALLRLHVQMRSEFPMGRPNGFPGQETRRYDRIDQEIETLKLKLGQGER